MVAERKPMKFVKGSKERGLLCLTWRVSVDKNKTVSDLLAAIDERDILISFTKSEPTSSSDGRCELCGEPMSPGEESFRYHGHSGPCVERCAKCGAVECICDAVADKVPVCACGESQLRHRMEVRYLDCRESGCPEFRHSPG